MSQLVLHTLTSRTAQLVGLVLLLLALVLIEGITVPVIGVGLIAQVTNLFVATICLAVVIAFLLLLTLAALLRSGRRVPLRAGSA